MTCCPATIVTFTNQPSSTIGYTGGLAEQYGPEPNVQVFYKEGTEFVQSEFSEVKFNGSTIIVDHGGLNTGIIKIF